MTRKYAATSGPLSIDGAGDLLVLSLSSNGYAEVERITVTCVDTTLPTAQMLQVEGVLVTAATVGSGGSAADIAKIDGGDADPGVSAVADLGSGTSGDEQIVYQGGCYAYQGVDFVFQEPVALNSVGDVTAFVVRLPNNPAGTVTLVVTVYFSEKGLTGS